MPSAASAPNSGPVIDHPDWPLRPWLLAAVLAVCGWLVWFISDRVSGNPPPLSAAAMVALITGGLAFAFSAERLRLQWSALFGIGAGLVMGGIAWHVARMQPNHAFQPDFAFVSAIASLLIAVPLFQTMRDKGHWRVAADDYQRTHFHVWADVVIGGAALLFTGIAWLLLHLLSALFDLINIHLLSELISKGWFILPFSAAAFGAALGILRDNEKVLCTLQRLVMLVLSVLAPVFAFGLVVFLGALLFTGLDTLWDATRNATPILIGCAIAAFILANAVIRNSDEDASGSRILRIAALVQALCILPLAIIAMISTGLRIGQYGFTPDRIWAAIAIAVTVAYGAAQWIALARGRMAGWANFARQANLWLALGVCGLALFLALPLLDFGAMSTRSQLARLDSGKVKAADFDWQALQFDFGPAGRAALAARAKSGPADHRELAAAAIKREYREWQQSPSQRSDDDQRRAAILAKVNDQVKVVGNNDAVRDAVLRENAYMLENACDRPCALFIDPTAADGSTKAVLAVLGSGMVRQLVVKDGVVVETPFEPSHDWQELQLLPKDAKVEIRVVDRRQVFINGKPFGTTFE